MLYILFVFFLMIRRPPRSTRTHTTLSLHDALPISEEQVEHAGQQVGAGADVMVLVDGQLDLGAAHEGLPRRAPDPAQRRPAVDGDDPGDRSEEHTSELQSLMRISYAVFCLKKKTQCNIIRRHKPTNAT